MNVYRLRDRKRNSFICINKKKMWLKPHTIREIIKYYKSSNDPNVLKLNLENLEIVEFELKENRTIKLFDSEKNCSFCGRELEFEKFSCDICGKKFCDSCVIEDENEKHYCHDCR